MPQFDFLHESDEGRYFRQTCTNKFDIKFDGGDQFSDCYVCVQPFNGTLSQCNHNSYGYVKPGDEAPYDYSHLPSSFLMRFRHEEFTWRNRFTPITHPPEWLVENSREFFSGVLGIDAVVKLERSFEAEKGDGTTGLLWEWTGEVTTTRDVKRVFRFGPEGGQGFATQTITVQQPVTFYSVRIGETRRVGGGSSCDLYMDFSFRFDQIPAITLPAVPQRGLIPAGSDLDDALINAGYNRPPAGYPYPTVWLPQSIQRVGDLDLTINGDPNNPFDPGDELTRYNYDDGTSTDPVTGLPYQTQMYRILWPRPNDFYISYGLSISADDAAHLMNFTSPYRGTEYGNTGVSSQIDTWTPLPTQPIELRYLYEDPDPESIQQVFPGSSGHEALWFTADDTVSFGQNAVFNPEQYSWRDQPSGSPPPFPTRISGIRAEFVGSFDEVEE